MKFSYFTFIIMLFLSCNNNDEKQHAAQLKDAKKKELIFKNISNNWKFSYNFPNSTSNSIINNWSEWKSFNNELNDKPKSSIGAFQKKAKTLSKKSAELNNNIPLKFNKPEIKSRIAVLTTKLNSINLFINLQDIPDQKVIVLISEIRLELNSLSNQMDEIVRKSEIPKEDGEADLIRMSDTARAIPSSIPVQKNKAKLVP